MGIEPTTSELDLQLLYRLSYEVGQRKSGTIKVLNRGEGKVRVELDNKPIPKKPSVFFLLRRQFISQDTHRIKLEGNAIFRMNIFQEIRSIYAKYSNLDTSVHSL